MEIKRIVILVCLVLCAHVAYGISYDYQVRPLYTTTQNLNKYKSTSTMMTTSMDYSSMGRSSMCVSRGVNNGAQYNRIGYRTNYSNGVFNTMSITTTRTSTDVYRPGVGGPRRIQVYNGQGDSINTPGKNDNTGWKYRYDKTTNEWWASEDGGLTWKKWDTWLGLGWWDWTSDWRENRGDPTENSTKWASDPDDPFLDPIEDDIKFLLFLSGVYAIYLRTKKYLYSRRNPWIFLNKVIKK